MKSGECTADVINQFKQEPYMMLFTYFIFIFGIFNMAREVNVYSFKICRFWC